jgi:hypothetical protein
MHSRPLAVTRANLLDERVTPRGLPAQSWLTSTLVVKVQRYISGGPCCQYCHEEPHPLPQHPAPAGTHLRFHEIFTLNDEWVHDVPLHFHERVCAFAHMHGCCCQGNQAASEKAQQLSQHEEAALRQPLASSQLYRIVAHYTTTER